MLDVIDRTSLRAPQAPRPALGPLSQPESVDGDHQSGEQLQPPSVVLVLIPLRLFLAAGWLRAGVEKTIEPNWWNGRALRQFLVDQRHDALPFFRPVMEHVVAPGAKAVAIVVMLTQIGCGLAIGAGKHLRLALRWGFLLNVTFILAGRVNPSAFYLVMEAVLLFAIADGVIGVRPTSPSPRTLAAAVVSAALGLLVVPYIRTIEPSKVIEDPAMMLSFMGSIIAVTLLFRRASHRPHEARIVNRLWTRSVAGWVCAKPRRLVHLESRAHTKPEDRGVPSSTPLGASPVPGVGRSRPLPPPTARRQPFAPPRPGPAPVRFPSDSISSRP